MPLAGEGFKAPGLSPEKPKRRKRRRSVQIRCPVASENSWIIPKKLHISEEDSLDTFRKFDRRRLGYFTEKDVKRVFGGSGNAQYKEFMARFDANGDGQIDFDEFKETLAEFIEEKGEISALERIYVTLSEPSSSIIARWTSLFIMFLIILSTLSFVLDTVPAFKLQSKSNSCCGLNNKQYEKYQSVTTIMNYTSSSECACEPESRPVFMIVEVVCISIFTAEYLMRVLTVWASRFGPDFEVVLDVVTVHREQRPWMLGLERTWGFVANPMNLIDLFAILPFYMAMMDSSDGSDGSGLGFLRVLRLARVFRVFKMGKYNKGMQLFTKVMVHSAPALKLLCFFTVIGMILFGSLIYFFERGFFVVTEQYPDGAFMRPDVTGLHLGVSPFTSIPACFWWVIVTQTTVGYGDSYPTSDVGKIIGSLCMITGVLVLALPITIIGANFANEYAKVQAEEARERHLQNAANEAAKAKAEHEHDGKQKGATDPAATRNPAERPSGKPSDRQRQPTFLSHAFSLRKLITGERPSATVGASTTAAPADGPGSEKGGTAVHAFTTRDSKGGHPESEDLLIETLVDIEGGADALSEESASLKRAGGAGGEGREGSGGGLGGGDTHAPMGEEDEEEEDVNDMELIRPIMNLLSSDLIGLIRDFIEAERLTKLAGDGMMSEIHLVMRELDNKDATIVNPDVVQGMLTVAWHWMGRCEKDEATVIFPEHKLQLMRKFWEFAASTVRAP